MPEPAIPTGLISVPNRYMHSPNEVVSLTDVKTLFQTAKLLAGLRFDRSTGRHGLHAPLITLRGDRGTEARTDDFRISR